MVRMLVLMLVLLFSTMAHATVYKCSTSSGTVYSEHPCEDKASSINTHASEPTQEDVAAANSRTASQNSQVDAFKKDHEKRVLQVTTSVNPVTHATTTTSTISQGGRTVVTRAVTPAGGK